MKKTLTPIILLLFQNVFVSNFDLPLVQLEQEFQLANDFNPRLIVREKDVTFHWYTRENKDNYTQIFRGHLNNVDINASKPFKFIIHGYTDNAGKNWVLRMKNQLLIKDDYNVIAVDWSGPAMFILYPVSALATRDVGKFLGNLIVDLHKTKKVPYENIHLIGHSLGAHVSSFAGKFTIDNQKKVKIGRITGMDPAGPSFVGNPPDNRLYSGDADFVDVIHTAGLTVGYYDAIGDVDFYVNSGTALQPGCITRDIIADIVSCSHMRAYIYYIESINSNGFTASKCDSYRNYINKKCIDHPTAIMGENVDQSVRGVYHLTTNNKTPFARWGEI